MSAATQQAQLVRVTSTDGTPIGLWKTGSGPSLVAVHGAGADHTAWNSVLPYLADTFTVYAMDRRGRGASGDAPEYTLEREFEDVAAAVAAAPGPVHLYGHSFGGTCAFEAALRTPHLASLILYEGSGIKPPGLRITSDELIAELEALIAAGKREEALELFMLRAAGVTAEELPAMKRNPAWPGRVAAVHTIAREVRAINDYAGADLTKAAALTTPVLLVLGSQTPARRREMFEGTARAVPNARIAVLPGQGHAAHNTAPDLLAAAIRDFIGSL